MFYPHLTLYGLVERNLSFSLLYIRNLLDSIQQDLHQMVVVKAINLDKKVVLSCYKVTLYNFGNVFERLDYLGVFIGLRQRDTYKCTHVQSEGLWLYKDA